MTTHRIRAALAQRCPACLQGRMFDRPLHMSDDCPACGHHFEREPGFFQGAMYVSYTIACGTFAILALSAQAWLAPQIGLARAFAIAFAIQIPLVPLLWRYSRVFWAHINVGTQQQDS